MWAMWPRSSPAVQQHLCQLCRERYRGGLYRSGHPRCDWCGGVVQHQRRVGLGPIQHRQQQRGSALCQQPRTTNRPADADSNNSYQFVVSATEAGNTFVATRSLTVTVSDVGDVAPVFTSANSISASFAENATSAVYTAQATPDAGGAVSYSISSGADSARFSIDSSSGVVQICQQLPTLKPLPMPTATTAINLWFQRPRRATPLWRPAV